MNNIIIRFNSKEDARKLADLSKQFAKENSCNAIIADDEVFFLNHKVAVAISNGKIVGYCYGKVEKEVKNRTYSQKNDFYFDLEEIYVLPKYRNCGVGQKLYNFVEDYAKKENCKTLRLNAVSKDYKRLLSFYIDKLKMNFWSAYLIKNIKGDEND